MSPRPFSKPIHPKDVKDLIDFGLSIQDNSNRYASMAKIQTEGVAALYNILCKLPFAYLADEVGMGKTYQAIGLASILWNIKPDARIIFISPRKNLQTKWQRDFLNFIRDNYRRTKKLKNLGDNILKCVVSGNPVIKT